jgi:hypothetical protein
MKHVKSYINEQDQQSPRQYGISDNERKEKTNADVVSIGNRTITIEQFKESLQDESKRFLDDYYEIKTGHIATISIGDVKNYDAIPTVGTWKTKFLPKFLEPYGGAESMSSNWNRVIQFEIGARIVAGELKEDESGVKKLRNNIRTTSRSTNEDMLAPVGSLPSAGSPPPSPHSPGFSHSVPGNTGVANNVDIGTQLGKTDNSTDSTKPKKKKKKKAYASNVIKSFTEFKSRKA